MLCASRKGTWSKGFTQKNQTVQLVKSPLIVSIHINGKIVIYVISTLERSGKRRCLERAMTISLMIIPPD